MKDDIAAAMEIVLKGGGSIPTLLFIPGHGFLDAQGIRDLLMGLNDSSLDFLKKLQTCHPVRVFKGKSQPIPGGGFGGRLKLNRLSDKKDP